MVGDDFGKPKDSEVRKWYRFLTAADAPGQTQNHLKDDGGYCCLGLYAEKCGYPFKIFFDEKTLTYTFSDGAKAESALLPTIAAEMFWDVKPESEAYVYNPYLKVPEHLRDKTETSATEEELNDAEDLSDYAVGESCCASSLNDDYGFTFAEIAECVKETWPEAFTE